MTAWQSKTPDAKDDEHGGADGGLAGAEGDGDNDGEEEVEASEDDEKVDFNSGFGILTSQILFHLNFVFAFISNTFVKLRSQAKMFTTFNQASWQLIYKWTLERWIKTMR